MTPRRSPQGASAGRLVWSLLGGVLLGLAIGLLLQAAIQRTATPLPPDRAFWQLLLLGFAGGLVGFALSAVSALQAANPDPDYHRARQGLRPSSRRPPGQA
jgi:NhaP-type Na+/H+ or K+/H+ antiporter